MVFLVLIALASIGGVFFSVFVPGWADVLLIAAPCAIASVVLVFQRWLSGSWRAGRDTKWAILDGSNVMHWRDGEPSFEPIHDVVRKLKKLGFMPGVMFDANAGYLLDGRYLDDDIFATRLGLPEQAVIVAPKGCPADPIILAAARDLAAIVITNDRYRDWADEFPEVLKSGTLVGGGYRSGQLWLDSTVEQV